MTIIQLVSNRPTDRFYRGGLRITQLRGEPDAKSHEPEDWIASTTRVAGEEVKGLTVLPDGRLLTDAIAADPVAWLGAAHVARFGVDTKLLVKLLDAGQRLPVHAHPHADFAREYLARAHGKAEAWYILNGGSVHLGLIRDVDENELAELVCRQDSAELLSLLHEIPVQRGDAVYVPPGTLHAIGEGTLILEVQEPEDLSILLEWQGFALDGRTDGHLGLGFERALQAVERQSLSAGQRDALVVRDGRLGSVLPDSADAYFRLERVVVDGSAAVDAGFAILLMSRGRLQCEDGTVLAAGATAVVSYSTDPLRLEGSAEILIARPPRAEKLSGTNG